MKIIHIAPFDMKIPPRFYGGTERVAWNLFQEQIRLGINVYLIGKIDRNLIPQDIRKYCIDIEKQGNYESFNRHAYCSYLLLVFRYIKENFPDVDIIHNHVLQHNVWLYCSNIHNTVPVLTTLHYDPPFKESLKILNHLKLFSFLRRKKKYANAISRFKFYSLKRYLGNLLIGYIHNGIPFMEYFVTNKKDDYYLSLGAISYNKGTHIAIYIARKLDLRLYIAGPIREKSLIPLLNKYKNVKYLGEIDDEKKKELLSRAKALLMPVTWEEPFGLVAVEAMASGTPVIAFNRGALSEIVTDGINGFLANSLSEFISKLKRVDDILNPSLIRNYSLRKFDTRVIARKYLLLYEKLLRL